MSIMNWDKSLDIGVDKMNHDHQDILTQMNRIFDAAQAGVTGPTINLLVTQLGDICSKHFAAEEAYMASIGFPGLENHKVLHKNLLTKFAAHQQAIRDAGGVANDPFFGFLKFWLSSHIKGVDVKYAAHAGAHAF